MDRSLGPSALASETSTYGQHANDPSRAASIGVSLQASQTGVCTPLSHLASGKRGLQTGLKRRKRTVFLFSDETLISEIPPLRAAWALRGQQAEVPMKYASARQILFGTLNVKSGDLLVEQHDECKQGDFQHHLRAIRRKWRGWQIILFIDQAPWHIPRACRQEANRVGIELRWLPVACPELNPMDDLWRHVKNGVLANEPTPDVVASAHRAKEELMALSPRERLRKAGVLSGRFWLRVAQPEKSESIK